MANDKVFSDICQVFSLCTNRKVYKRLHKISLAFVGHDTLDQIVQGVCLCMDMWNTSHGFCKCLVSCVKKPPETLVAVAADHLIEVSSEEEGQGLLRVHLLLIM